jgi:hypothetical protein
VLASLDISNVVPYRNRPYEWVAATAAFSVDPSAGTNSRITDLTLAPRHEDGSVRFESDVRLLRPTGQGNGKVLLVVPNRGMLGGVPFSLDLAATAFAPTEDPDPGDGFLLDSGWAIAWCGWQWDVHRHQGWLGLDAPLAGVEPGWMRVEFRPDVELPDHRLSDSSAQFEFKDYPTADRNDQEASLTVRTSPLGDKRLLPRESWRFSDQATVVLDGGFQPFHWYELIYRTSLAPVIGAGLLAVRDFSSWLHQQHDRVFAFGISQSGRFLRQFLHDGLNLDEDGRRVFDGVFTHITGARRGEFNCRYGQPSLTHPLSPAYGPPYDMAGLLSRQRAAGGVPKVLSTNSSWEYWRGDGALLHQDAETGEDLPEDGDARTYLLSASDHYGATPLKDLLPAANPVHHLDVAPLLRALFVGLERWVCDGVEPPPSGVPRRASGTLVEREKVLGQFHDTARPDPAFLPWTPGIDPINWSWPLALGEPKVALVSDVDEGGNEVAGIRLPAVAAPVAAYTGWNPRVRVEGLPGVLYEFVGSRLPLQHSAAWPERADYEQKARQAARSLVDGRYLLERDLERTVAEAMRLYDTRP